MELQVLEKRLPLKAYPEKQLDDILKTKFKYWLGSLLSIKPDNEEKLDIALPVIKKKFWSLGLNEVKKAFEMYALGELGITPKSNYFDIILVGQIFNAYRQQKRTKSSKVKIAAPEISEDEKEFLWVTFIINCFEEYKHRKKMLTGFTEVYKHFYEADKFPKHDHKFREAIRGRAIVKLKRDPDLNYSEENITIKCKEIILGDWFEKLIENKTDIKNEI